MGSRPLLRGLRVEVEEGSNPCCEGVRRALRFVDIESSIWLRESLRKSRRKRVLKQNVGLKVGCSGGCAMMRFCDFGVWRGREDGGGGEVEAAVWDQNHASLTVKQLCSVEGVARDGISNARSTLLCPGVEYLYQPTMNGGSLLEDEKP